MNPLAWFLGQTKHYLSGKGSPSVLIIFWWGFLNIAALIAGTVTINYIVTAEEIGALNMLQRLLAISVGILGLIIAFIYPFILGVSLWRCAANADVSWGKWPLRILLAPMMLVQLQLSLMYSVGGFALIASFQS